MKRFGPILLLLAVLSIISGFLLSKASWIGRVGISLMYQQYSFLKVWWQAGLAIFTALVVLFIIHALLRRRLSQASGNIAIIVLLLLAIVGLYATYHDFRHDFSHRMLGERFHLGVYLFWIDWMLVSLYFLFQKKEVEVIAGNDKGQQ